MSAINFYKNKYYYNELYENQENIIINKLGDDNENIFDINLSPNYLPSFHFEDVPCNKEKSLSNCLIDDIKVPNSVKASPDNQALLDNKILKNCKSNSKVSIQENLELKCKEECKESSTIPTMIHTNSLNRTNTDIQSLKPCSEIEHDNSPCREEKYSLLSLKQLIEGDKQNDSERIKRFGRIEDRDMFEILKAICKEKDCDLFNFCTKNWRTCQKINDILCLMLVRTNFKGNKTLLLKRIQKLLLNQEYSVREEKLFKKLVSIQLKSGKIDFNQIEYFLPGKNPEEIRRKAGRILISL